MAFDEEEHQANLAQLSHQPLMAAAPSPTPLDALISATLELPGARITGRDSGMIRVELGAVDRRGAPGAGHQQLIFLLEERSLVERIHEVQASLRWGAQVTFVAHDSPANVSHLRANVPAPWKFGKASQAAATWSSEGGLKRVRNRNPTLQKAARAALALGDVSLDEKIARRETEQDEAARFFEVLRNTRAATIAIAVASSLVFVLQLVWGEGNPGSVAPRMGAGIPSLVRAEPWRLLAPMLLHANVVHLLLNLSALFSFGTLLERLLGWRRYVVLYVVSGLGGELLSMTRSEDVIGVGASGGIWGLMVAGAVLVTFPRGTVPALTAATMRGRVWGPVAMNALYSLGPGIDLRAHLGGGLVGGLFALLVIPRLSSAAQVLAGVRKPGSTLGLVAACLALVGLLGSTLFAFWSGAPWELTSGPRVVSFEFPDQAATIEVPSSLAYVEYGPGERGFGRLLTDPVGVVVQFESERLSEEQARDPVGTLEASRQTLPTGIDEFALVGEVSVIADGERRALMVSSLSAPDRRTAQSTWVLENGRLARVLVFSVPTQQPAWSEAATRAARSLRLR